MPNHCENDLDINGSKEEIARFRAHAREELNPLSTEKFIPYPKEFNELWKKDKSIPEQVLNRLRGWTV